MENMYGNRRNMREMNSMLGLLKSKLPTYMVAAVWLKYRRIEEVWKGCCSISMCYEVRLANQSHTVA